MQRRGRNNFLESEPSYAPWDTISSFHCSANWSWPGVIINKRYEILRNSTKSPLLSSIGMSSVSRDNVTTLLSQSNDKDSPTNKDGCTSNATFIVVGGAQEALYMRPNEYKIVLKKRKGFIKLAIRNGASLVPVFSFGELDLYDAPANPPGSKLRRWQDLVKAVTGIAPTKFIGRGFFQYSYGMIPRRKTLNLVFGAPIDVVKTAEPSEELVDEYHQKFTDGLIDLFETNKVKFIKEHEGAHLEIE